MRTWLLAGGTTLKRYKRIQVAKWFARLWCAAAASRAIGAACISHTCFSHTGFRLEVGTRVRNAISDEVVASCRPADLRHLSIRLLVALTFQISLSSSGFRQQLRTQVGTRGRKIDP